MESSSTFLARGVKGSCPIVTIEGPVLTIFSTSVRILFRSIPHVLEDVGSDAAALLDEAEKNVLSTQVLVVEPLRLLPREVHHLLGSVREAIKHVVLCLLR